MSGDIELLSKSVPKKGATLFERFATNLLERDAEKQDTAINEELLKELIMKYVSSERRLTELNTLKNKFLGMAAHDLRNPLVSIRGFADLLLEGGMDEASVKEFLEIIRQSADDSLGLINDLLDLSVIESGKLDLDLNENDMPRLLEERALLMRHAASKKGITIGVEAENIPQAVFDRGKIGQVIDNYLSNAVKYSPVGSAAVARVSVRDEEIWVEVIDRGPGIPPEELKCLFGEFHKTSVRPTGGEKSTGLGLAIARRIVEAHHGRVGVESKVGEGSLFHFAIPVIQK
ncbi:MAG: HAMP domain-containing histidine kinase [Nitrospinota bacterium]|nr:HAMP domain-containing histidine kinase [Nitrospinota bacterium]